MVTESGMNRLEEARRLTEDITPLRDDCGRLCAGKCCISMEGEETGMLLFPGEEAYYAGRAEYSVKKTEAGLLLICSGRCERAERPLSCRIFPLLPVIRADGVKVAMDARAGGVCPLADQGTSALRQDFVEAVRACGTVLMEDEEQRAFLQRLTIMHDELRAMRKQWGVKGHV